MAVVSFSPPGRGWEKGELSCERETGDRAFSGIVTRIVTSRGGRRGITWENPFGFNLIAPAVGVGEGDILGEEPIKTWGEEATSSHFDCMTLKYGGICIPNVFIFLPEINCLHLHVDSQMVKLFIAKHV